uniref:AAA family ATPase n=1 Tax=Streptomyces sp. NBC_00998 TaxID=2903712 RepID=UPI002F918029|nr:ATP-binding protein [Streptomyces sp. NBC_00998]
MTSLTFPYLPDACLVVLIGASGAGKSTLARTWPASQVLSLDILREVVSDDFSVKSSVLSVSPA